MSSCLCLPSAVSFNSIQCLRFIWSTKRSARDANACTDRAFSRTRACSISAVFRHPCRGQRNSLKRGMRGSCSRSFPYRVYPALSGHILIPLPSFITRTRFSEHHPHWRRFECWWGTGAIGNSRRYNHIETMHLAGISHANMPNARNSMLSGSTCVGCNENESFCNDYYFSFILLIPR